MEIIISDEARAFVLSRGGTVYVRANERKCCGGAMVLLDATTTPPRHQDGALNVSADDVAVSYQGHPRGVPNQLLIEMRGVLRRHLAAYKDGCVFPL
ncbi:MAG: hypothetical protein ACHQFZ_06140 [Acidimicrobiales bacterium]